MRSEPSTIFRNRAVKGVFCRNRHGEWKHICLPAGRQPAGDLGCGAIMSEENVWCVP